MVKPKQMYQMLQSFLLMSQVGFAFLIPFVGIVWLAFFLTQRYQLPGWVMAAALFLGLFSGLFSVYRIMKAVLFKQKSGKEGRYGNGAE